MNSTAHGHSPYPDAGLRWPTAPTSTKRLPQPLASRVTSSIRAEGAFVLPFRSLPRSSACRVPAAVPRAHWAACVRESFASYPRRGPAGIERSIWLVAKRVSLPGFVNISIGYALVAHSTGAAQVFHIVALRGPGQQDLWRQDPVASDSAAPPARSQVRGVLPPSQSARRIRGWAALTDGCRRGSATPRASPPTPPLVRARCSSTTRCIAAWNRCIPAPHTTKSATGSES